MQETKEEADRRRQKAKARGQKAAETRRHGKWERETTHAREEGLHELLTTFLELDCYADPWPWWDGEEPLIPTIAMMVQAVAPARRKELPALIRQVEVVLQEVKDALALL